jgi:hypothetical protein
MQGPFRLDQQGAIFKWAVLKRGRRGSNRRLTEKFMIRKLVILFALGAATLASSAYAEHRDIDLHDYDDDLMRDLDKTIKYFEPDITARNAQGALDDAAVLQDGFKYTEGYFAKKGDADDAVQLSKEGLGYIAAAIKSVSENNFDAAAEAARGAAKTCRACHDTYKPLKK